MKDFHPKKYILKHALNISSLLTCCSIMGKTVRSADPFTMYSEIKSTTINAQKLMEKVFFRTPDEPEIKCSPQDDKNVNIFSDRRGSSTVFTLPTIYHARKKSQSFGPNSGPNELDNPHKDATRPDNQSCQTQSPHLSSTSKLNCASIKNIKTRFDNYPYFFFFAFSRKRFVGDGFYVIKLFWNVASNDKKMSTNRQK